MPAALVPPAEQAILAQCTAMGGAGFCTPDPFIAAGGNLIAPTCVSIGGAEGRCASDCLPPVIAEEAILPVSTCGSRVSSAFPASTQRLALPSQREYVTSLVTLARQTRRSCSPARGLARMSSTRPPLARRAWAFPSATRVRRRPLHAGVRRPRGGAGDADGLRNR